ncbi:MAG: type II secretion system protein [Opitutaceae bacterium]|jgi:prepilin-type N-terminal cleavage/methylation domain-containing protein/prepilin-type processing-associated H-X9-DG protein
MSKRTAFTLVELLATIAIIGILASITIVALSRVRSASQKTQCASNLRQLSQAILANAYDNKGVLILAYEYGPKNEVNAMWYEPKSQLASYAGGGASLLKLAVCPTLYRQGASPVDTMGNSVRSPDGLPYVVNYNIMANSPGDSVRVRLNQIPRVSQTVLMTDTQELPSGWGQGFSNPAYTSWQRVGVPHNSKTSVLWCDGHVTLQAIDEIRDKVIL